MNQKTSAYNTDSPHYTMIFTIATLFVYFTFTLIVLAGLLDGWCQVCKQRKEYKQLLNSIANMTATKKQMIELARAKSIKYSGLNKYQLANRIIMELA